LNRVKAGLRVVFMLLFGLISASGSGYCYGQSWPFWEAYSSAFIDGQGRVIDSQGASRTTSEGQAYAMFFALVANDRPRFDRLLHWVQDNLAAGDLKSRLPGWEWGRAGDGQWHLLDSNSAADADLWMSYTLLEAGRLWSESYYTDLGRGMAARIAAEEVAELPGFGTMLLPAPTGFHPDNQTWCLNPSYVPLPLVVRLEQIDPHGPWQRIASSIPKMLQLSSHNGFAMDWVNYSSTGGFVATFLPGQPNVARQGSYDAIRVYLWAGMADRNMPGRDAVLRAVSGMSTFLKKNSLPPERVNDRGFPLVTPGPVGFSAALMPYLDAVGAKKELEQQRRLVEAQTDSKTKLLGPRRTYYDQNLALFGSGWMDQRLRFGSNGELKVSWKKE
jgi:endoglucanase